MDLCIVWENEDGGVSITYPVPEARVKGETDEQFAERIRQKDVPAGRPFHIQAKDKLPKNRRLRDAWRLAGNAIAVDGPIAREVVLAEVRAERNRRLAETDAEKSRIEDIGTEKEKKDIKDKRQALRDLPAKVEAEIAKLTTDQLSAYQPPWPDSVHTKPS